MCTIEYTQLDALSKKKPDSGLPFSICRPGMIIGHSRTGRFRTFNTVYYILKQVLLGKMRFLPIQKDTPLNLVPVDYVTDAALKIAESDSADGMTFHLTCPAEKAIAQSRKILAQLGVREQDQFSGILNAGHPGGMLPLTEKEKDSLHHPSLPENLYVSDATILPCSMGNPPMLTIMALAKKIAAGL